MILSITSLRRKITDHVFDNSFGLQNRLPPLSDLSLNGEGRQRLSASNVGSTHMFAHAWVSLLGQLRTTRVDPGLAE